MRLLISLILEDKEGKTTNAVHTTLLRFGVETGQVFSKISELIKENENNGFKIVDHAFATLPE